MSKRVLFNGAVLVRPGAATKIDASQFQNIILAGLGIVGLIGTADGGQPRTVQAFNSPDGVRQFYQSGDLVEAAAMVADPSNDPRVPNGASAIVCYKVNNSTQATRTIAPFVFTSRKYGILTNNVQVGVSVPSGTQRVVTVTDIDAFGTVITETSPTLGTTARFAIQYTGAAASSTLTTTATTIATTNAGGVDQFSLNFADFPNLAVMLQFIASISNAGTPVYSVTSIVSNASSFNPANLDLQSAVNIKASPTSIFAVNWEIGDWINNQSQIITAVVTLAQVITAAVTTAGLAGGTRGSSANSDWVTGFTALRGTRINQLVPLASADGVAPDTYTFASIAAAATAHGRFVSSTLGKNECQIWMGQSATITNLILTANTQNSEHLCLFGQKAKRLKTADGSLPFFAEWSSAAVAAGMRAGANIGEPMTWKYPSVLGVSSDASWSESNNDDVTNLTLNGVNVINNLASKGFRFDKMQTTYTKQDNDAYTEETIVQIWKLVAFNLRTALEDTYVGRGGTVALGSTVPATVAKVMQPLKDAGAITDSIVNGKVINAWRNINWTISGDTMTVSVTVSPTPGINFILTTIVLVPAQISGIAA